MCLVVPFLLVLKEDFKLSIAATIIFLNGSHQSENQSYIAVFVLKIIHRGFYLKSFYMLENEFFPTFAYITFRKVRGHL